MRFGDDPRWADPAYDDGDWPTKRLYPAPDTQGVHWVRVPVRVEPTSSQNGPVGVHLSMLSAAEVYWDGVQIGQNGRVAHSRAQERPGTIEYLAHVPDSLYTSGEHLLALRLSNYYMPRDFEYYLYSLELGPYRAFQESALSELLPLLFLGAFVLVMLYCGVLYVLDRRRPIGIFGLLCGAVALLLALESARELAQYTYDWHPVRIDAITALTAAVGALLPWFFAEQFEVPRRPLVMGSVGAGLALAFLVPDAADFKAYWMYWTALAVSLGITGWAVLQQKRGAWLALLGVGACIGALLAFDRQFAYRYFFPSFALVVAAVLATLAQRARERERQRQKAELTATRLEVQLLKKHLQPHFLMNTLTAAIEWLESDPEVGARFIEALAEELRLLSDISDQPVIPLRRELHLCRLHLQVMGFRQDRTFQLRVEDVDEEALVPPATFHTLLENAITHNRYDGSEIVFRLQGEALGGGRRYVLVAPLGADPPGVSSNRPSDNGSSDNRPSDAEGTGLRYVKACLREQYGTSWAVRSGPETSEADTPVWRTTIDIYDDE
jgi:hypothetical protein